MGALIKQVRLFSETIVTVEATAGLLDAEFVREKIKAVALSEPTLCLSFKTEGRPAKIEIL